VPNRLGCYHRVARGDTLSSLARKYGVESGALASANGIRGAFIRAGERLFIPDGREQARKVAMVRNRSAAPERVAEKKRRAEKSDVSGRSSSEARIAFDWPIHGKITSGFGTRKDPFSGDRKFHCGIDISANEGTPVRAAAEGAVIFSGWKDGYGLVVILRHERGYITVYAHNSRNLVEEGAAVKRGQTLALSGQTGAVTGAHVHFEIRKYLTPLNPLRFL
jgi:murein DD-endopeptidase MepM/ murein hydrolase activator NlpD